jgi:hypothetical protein
MSRAIRCYTPDKYAPDKGGCRGEAAMHENWWGWLGIIILFAIVQAWRALFRSTKGTRDDGLKRLNAAAERILKERGASAGNPIPRTHAKSTRPVRIKAGTAKPRNAALLPKSTTPAVIRRSDIFSAGREPVIQRRR